MHPFMAAVLLGMGRLDGHDLNVQPNEPDGQPSESDQTRRGKRASVIREDGFGQAVLAEELFKSFLG